MAGKPSMALREFAQYTSTVDIVVGEEERRRGEEIWISDSRFGFGFGFGFGFRFRFGFGFGFGSGFGSGSGFGVGLGVECGTTVHTF